MNLDSYAHCQCLTNISLTLFPFPLSTPKSHLGGTTKAFTSGMVAEINMQKLLSQIHNCPRFARREP